MKKPILSLYPIEKFPFSNMTISYSSRKGMSSAAGSITFEAALIMPIFILFLFVFYLLLMTISAQMALQATASSSVTQISAHIHPIAIIVEGLQDRSGSHSTVEYNDVDEGWRKTVYDLSDRLPSPVDSLVQEGLKGNWWPATNLAGTVLGQDILNQLIQSQVSSPMLQKEAVELSYLQLPDLINHTDLNVTLALQYQLPIKIPLIDKPIIIREQAMQRVWIPDVRPASYKITEKEDVYIYVVSLVPNPVKPGHKATLKVITIPNSNIELEVIYKSGSSVAKHLGIVTSNEKGEAEWTWHVSGNTTPGTWSFIISLPEKSFEIQHGFSVVKSS